MKRLTKETKSFCFTPVGWDDEYTISYVESLKDIADGHCFRIFGKTDDDVLVESLFTLYGGPLGNRSDGKFFSEQEEVTLISVFAVLGKEIYDHIYLTLVRHEKSLDKIEVVVSYVMQDDDVSDQNFDIVEIQVSTEQGDYFSDRGEGNVNKSHKVIDYIAAWLKRYI